MIKGVNKNIIEVADTGNKYFNKAILFVNPEYTEKSAQELKNQANRFLFNIGAPSGIKKNYNVYANNRAKTKRLIRLICLSLIGCSILALFLIYKTIA